MNLKELRAKLDADRIKLADLKAKAFADAGTKADADAYEAALAECEKTLGQIKLAKREEDLEAESTKAAGDAARGGIGDNKGPDHKTWAEPARKVKEEQKPLMGIAAAHKSALIRKEFGEVVNPLKLLEDEGYGEFAGELKAKAARLQAMEKAGVFSTTSSGVLLPKPVTAEILPILYPEATFLQGGPRRVQFTSGQWRQPRGQNSATAAYVAEGALKPIGAPSFDDVSMQSHKLAGIVYVTNEAVKWAVGDLEAFIRQDLQTTMGLKMDLAMYFGTGVGATPLGLFNKPNITTIDGSMTPPTPVFANNRKPTVAELDTIATRMILSMTGANLVMTDKWRWTMGYRFWSYLTNLRDGNGNRIYPETTEATRTWKGIKILVSNQFAENGGANTDEGILGLVDYGHVLFGEEATMTMKSSTEATLNDNGTLVHLWQQNMSAVLCEMEHDVGLDQSKAVVQLNHVRAGSISSVAA